MHTRLTPAQEALVEASGSQYVEACPGAGKTRAIVARYLKRAQGEPRKGIALLSFTNAAIDEVVSRCGQHPDLLRNPNFIGTFDSFINTFIVCREYVRRIGSYPKFIDSWDAQSVTNIHLAGTPKYLEFELEWFDILPDEHRAILVQSRMGGKFKKQLQKIYEVRAGEVDQAAWKKWRARVYERGYVSCSASRTLLRRLLQKESVQREVGRLLSARFAEVIVDEAQDCGEEELLVLHLLHQSGVKIVMVGDPDQSIFEFRRAVPEKVREFGERLTKGARLGDNFRSTPAICAITASVRGSGLADSAEGENRSSTCPVILLPFKNLEEVAERAERIASEIKIDRRDLIILSHKQSDACAAALASHGGGGASKVLQVARAASVLKAVTSSSRQRRSALELAETVILSMIETVDMSSDSREAVCQTHEISERWLQSTALRICLGCNPELSRADFAKDLRERLSKFDWPAGITLRNLSDVLRAPDEANWQAEVCDASRAGLPYGTIHSSKGLEYETVVVVLPKQLSQDPDGATLIDQWENGIPTETKRVLYVGVSRAKKLLILAIHRNHLLRVSAVLKRDSVPFLVDEGGNPVQLSSTPHTSQETFMPQVA